MILKGYFSMFYDFTAGTTGATPAMLHRDSLEIYMTI